MIAMRFPSDLTSHNDHDFLDSYLSLSHTGIYRRESMSPFPATCEIGKYEEIFGCL
jgi:hypothetical protein